MKYFPAEVLSAATTLSAHLDEVGADHAIVRFDHDGPRLVLAVAEPVLIEALMDYMAIWEDTPEPGRLSTTLSDL
jgi:hypothetical protein